LNSYAFWVCKITYCYAIRQIFMHKNSPLALKKHNRQRGARGWGRGEEFGLILLQGLRNLSPTAPELCYKAVGALLQSLWSIVTAMLEKSYGGSAAFPDGCREQ
jgi:hypothetical protein